MKETNFKDTEVGRIPVDWEEKTIQDLGPISKGKGISRAECGTGDIPCVRYGEIYTVHDNYIKSFQSFISRNVADTSRKLQYGELLFTGSGETKEDIGKCVAYIGNEEAYAGGDIVIVTPNLEENDPFFLGYSMNDRYVVNQKALRGQGDAIVHITGKALSTIKIVLPPLNEQRKIASALNSIDNLITSLDKLIEKKKNIKQGTMQQLLSGNRRLIGFSDKWISKTIGDLCKPRKGSQLNKKELSDEAFGYPVMNGGIVPSGYYDVFNVCENTIIISEGGNSCGYVNYMKSKFWAGGHCYILSPQEDINIDYLYHVLKLCEPKIMGLRSGSGLPNIKTSALSDFSLIIAPSVEEQSAIAAVLTSMDNEIASLEAKKAKYELIKQGMMQQLLTGRIRLI